MRRLSFGGMVRTLLVVVMGLWAGIGLAQTSAVIDLSFDNGSLANDGASGTAAWGRVAPRDIVQDYYAATQESEPAQPLYQDISSNSKTLRLYPGYGLTVTGANLSSALNNNKVLRIETRFKLASALGATGRVDEKYIFDIFADYRDKSLQEIGGISLLVRNNNAGTTNLEIVFSDADRDVATKDRFNKIVLNPSQGIVVGEWVNLVLTLDLKDTYNVTDPRPPMLTAQIQLGPSEPVLFQKAVLNKYDWNRMFAPLIAGNSKLLVGGTSSKKRRNDRIQGELDVDFVRVISGVPDLVPSDNGTLVAALNSLTDHVSGSNVLGDEDVRLNVQAVEAFYGKYTTFFYADEDDIQAAANGYMQAYESANGPLFANRRSKVDVNDLPLEARALFYLQQNILLDHFNDSDVEKVSSLAYEARVSFPGIVQNAPSGNADPVSVIIDGDYQPYTATAFHSYAHRPTGFWAIAGREAEVCVDEDLLDEVDDVQVIVGAHRAFQAQKQTNRFHMISTEYSFAGQGAACITVANPFGGGIYVAIPAGSTLGDLAVTVGGGVVPSPYFDRRFRNGERPSGTTETSNSQWSNMLSVSGIAPWVDMESDNQLLTVPTIAAKTVLDAESVMTSWDNMWDQVTKATGREAKEGTLNRPRAMHIVVDSQAPCNCGGYPTHFPAYNAVHSTSAGTNVLQVNSSLFHLSNYVQHWFHEMGHGLRMPLLGGESETAPDFFNMVMFTGLGNSIDQAHEHSSRRNLDRLETAILWITREEFWGVDLSQNFREAESYSGTTNGTMPGHLRKYSTRGTAKYADLYDLFSSWETLGEIYNVFYEGWENDDFSNGDSTYTAYTDGKSVLYRRVKEKQFIDNAITAFQLNFNNVNPLPLLEFWGVVPDASQFSRASTMAESPEIYDLLQGYISALPSTQADFAQYYNKAAEVLTPSNVAVTQRTYDTYDTVYQRVNARLQRLMSDYFPNGDPSAPAPVRADLPYDVLTNQSCNYVDNNDYRHVIVYCNNSGQELQEAMVRVRTKRTNVLSETVNNLADGNAVVVLVDDLADRTQFAGSRTKFLEVNSKISGTRDGWCKSQFDPEQNAYLRVTRTATAACELNVVDK